MTTISSSNTLQGFPNTALPFVNPETGLIQQPWMQLLISLYSRTGATAGTSSNSGPAAQIQEAMGEQDEWKNPIENLYGLATQGEIGDVKEPNPWGDIWGMAFSAIANGNSSSSNLPVIPNNTFLANISGAPAIPIATTETAFLDSAIGNVRGDIIYRGASNWAALALGTNGYILGSNGTDIGYYNAFSQTIAAPPGGNSFAWELVKNATYTGNLNQTSFGLYVVDNVSSTVTGQEWGILSQVVASNSTGANVAVYGQIDSTGTAPGWGMVTEALAGTNGAVAVGIEVDCTRTGTGTAVGIDIVNAALGHVGTLDYGIRIPESAVYGISGTNGAGSPNNLSLNTATYGFTSNASYNIHSTNLYNTSSWAPGTNFSTDCSLYISATTQQASLREIISGVFMISTLGGNQSGSPQRDKVAFSSMVEAQNGSGDIWGIYPVVVLDNGSMGTNGYVAQGAEIDINNNTGVDLSNVTSINGHIAAAFGLSITGAGTNRSTAAIQIVGALAGGGPNFDKGIWFPGSSLSAAYTYTIFDQSNSIYSYYDGGSHSAGFVFGGSYSASGIILNGSFSGAGIDLSGGTFPGVNIKLSSNGIIQTSAGDLNLDPSSGYVRLLSSTYAASGTAATGAIPIKDSSGTVYYMRVSTSP